MNLSKYIIIIVLACILAENEKLIIADVDNPNFNSIGNLIFVFNNMKHGASTPCYGLNDQLIDIFGQQWSGYCELTKKGFYQLFKLGRIYQQRYNRIINIQEGDINKVVSYASQANKTLMSSNAFYYGLFMNKETPIEEQIVIPARNFKNIKDKELIPIFYFADSDNCVGWKKLIQKNFENLDFKINEYLNNFTSKYKNVFELLKNDERMLKLNTQYEKVDLFCSSYISNYYDGRCPKIGIFQQLKYTEEQFYDIYIYCLDFNLYKYYNIKYNGEAEKVPMIILSELITDLFKFMEKAIVTEENPKFVSYIGHDSTVSGLQFILEKAFDIKPKLMNYAANQVFLLIKNNNSNKNYEQNYNVKYFYNDELLLNIRYDEFKKSIFKLEKRENNIEFFCENFEPRDYAIISLFSFAIFLMFLIISTLLYYKNIIFKGKNKYIALGEGKKGKIIEIKN